MWRIKIKRSAPSRIHRIRPFSKKEEEERKEEEKRKRRGFWTKAQAVNVNQKDFPNLEIEKPDGTIESTKPTPSVRLITDSACVRLQ